MFKTHAARRTAARMYRQLMDDARRIVSRHAIEGAVIRIDSAEVVALVFGRSANADAARQLAFNRAVADGHPDARKKKAAVRRYWRFAKYVGVGDVELGTGLVDVQRRRVREGADAALAGMYGAARHRTGPAGLRDGGARGPVCRYGPGPRRFVSRMMRGLMRPQAELAQLLGMYGVPVAPLAVALVLGLQPAEYTVERPDTAVVPQARELPALNPQGAIEEAASALGEDASAREIAEHLGARGA